MNTDYGDLTDRVARGDVAIKPGTIRRGPAAAAAAAAAQSTLMEATGTSTIEELTRVAQGRPPLGAEPGASPVVRARVPKELKDRVSELAHRDHVKESDIIRRALALYTTALGAQNAPEDSARPDDTVNLKVTRNGDTLVISKPHSGSPAHRYDEITVNGADALSLLAQISELLTASSGGQPSLASRPG